MGIYSAEPQIEFVIVNTKLRVLKFETRVLAPRVGAHYFGSVLIGTGTNGLETFSSVLGF